MSTPEKKRLFTEGDLADNMSPDSVDAEQNNDAPSYELTKEKRKRFRRPSFGRPSFGFLSKRSTPDLRKLRKTPSSSSSKRTRSNSSTELPDTEEHKRRFSFTPFTDRRNNPQRAMTERRASKKSNKISTSDSDVRSSDDGSGPKSSDAEMKPIPCVKDQTETAGRKAKPELRAPLMNIKSISKPMVPGLLNVRRETLAVKKEEIITIDAYRPRRETLAVHREQPAIVPLKPRRDNLFLNKGEPVLESFKPKRDSLLLHKKVQPKKESIHCVKKQIYSDSENIDPCDRAPSEPSKNKTVSAREQKQPLTQNQRGAVWSQEFSTFGKSSIDQEVKKNDVTHTEPFHHARRMSTGSIAKTALTQLRTWVSFTSSI